MMKSKTQLKKMRKNKSQPQTREAKMNKIRLRKIKKKNNLLKRIKLRQKRIKKSLRMIKEKVYSFCFPSSLSKIFSIRLRKKKNVLPKILNNHNHSVTGKVMSLRRLKLMKSEEDRLSKTTLFDKLMTIRIKPNNMFCTLTSTTKKRAVSATSAKYRIKMSKKALKYNYKLILKSFIEETRKFFGKKMLISLTAPKRIRRELFRILKKKLTLKKKFTKDALGKLIPATQRILLFRFNAKKCFNGCRVRKKKRSKQRGLRIYK